MATPLRDWAKSWSSPEPLTADYNRTFALAGQSPRGLYLLISQTRREVKGYCRPGASPEIARRLGGVLLECGGLPPLWLAQAHVPPKHGEGGCLRFVSIAPDRWEQAPTKESGGKPPHSTF